MKYGLKCYTLIIHYQCVTVCLIESIKKNLSFNIDLMDQSVSTDDVYTDRIFQLLPFFWKRLNSYQAVYMANLNEYAVYMSPIKLWILSHSEQL